MTKHEAHPGGAQTPRQTPTDPRRAVRQMQGRTPAQRIAEAIWEVLGQKLFRCTFHNWYGIRRRLLRLFGARIHPTARVRPTVVISHPWRLSIGASSAVGDHAVLYCLGPITIRDRCTISQYSHLCAAGHDYTKKEMPLIMNPITIEDDVWIAADVFIGSGVTVGADTVVGARSTVLHDLPPGSICAGDSARRLADRVIRSGRAAARP